MSQSPFFNENKVEASFTTEQGKSLYRAIKVLGERCIFKEYDFKGESADLIIMLNGINLSYRFGYYDEAKKQLKFEIKLLISLKGEVKYQLYCWVRGGSGAGYYDFEIKKDAELNAYEIGEKVRIPDAVIKFHEEVILPCLKVTDSPKLKK